MISSTFLAYYVLSVNLFIIAFILFGLQKALIRANWPKPKRLRIIQLVVFILVAWFVIVAILSWFGVFKGAPDRFPTIGFGIVIPIIIGVLVLWLSKTTQRIIDIVPQQWLVGSQLYRIFGAIFLVLYAYGKIPGEFALSAGIGDVIVGLFAPIIAFFYSRKHKYRGIFVLVSNIFGIADLIAAVTLGFLTSPSPYQVLALKAPNELITAFPLVLIPVFAVPLSILLHIFSLFKLRGTDLFAKLN